MSAEMLRHGDFALELPLKGTRVYLHSTTILSALIERFGLTGAVKLEFRQMIHTPVRFVAAADPDLKPVGKFAFLAEGSWHSYAIVPDESRTINGRVDDNEREILVACTLADGTASADIGTPAGFVDTLVTLNKAVVGRHAGAGKKPLFSALSLEFVPAGGRLELRLAKHVGTKIYMSDAFIDGRKFGSLTFMTV